MRYTFISFFLISIILPGLSGCKESSLKSIREGEIHYKITYHERKAILPDELMPSTMVVKFKDDKTVMEITSPIGNNGVYIISKPDKNMVQTFMRVLNMKYYYEGTADEIPPGINPMEGMAIENTKQVASMLNLKCRKAIVRIPEMDLTYDIWYTEELGIKKPNSSNPFRAIDGVLINFFFLMGDALIEFEAEGIYQRPVPDKVFDKEEEFRRIDRKSMDNLIASMMSL
ncbi:MAG: hypothetical protein RQ743_05885 [Bacteroidales bacterium]|nr:hypothetical protein [Bacteroidales bacterium]